MGLTDQLADLPARYPEFVSGNVTMTVQFFFGPNGATKEGIEAGIAAHNEDSPDDPLHIYEPDNEMDGIHVNFKVPKPDSSGKTSVKVFLPNDRSGAKLATAWGVRGKAEVLKMDEVFRKLIAPVDFVKVSMVNYKLKTDYQLRSYDVCKELRQGAAGAIHDISGGHKTRVNRGFAPVTCMVFRGDGYRHKKSATKGGATIVSSSPAAVCRIVDSLAEALRLLSAA